MAQQPTPPLKIVVVGVGALGSHFVMAIRNLPVEITVIDFDRIESRNVQSQFHSKMGVGKNKALALQASMLGLFGLRVTAVPHKLTVSNVDVLLGGADVVVDCLDNGEGRKVIQDFVRARNVPCLHGALAADGAYGRVVWSENFSIDSEAGMTSKATCEDGEHLPFILSVAALMAESVRRFVRDGKQVGAEIHPNGYVRT